MVPILITPGEPAGVGPELVLQQASIGFNHPTVVAASFELMTQRAQQLELSIEVKKVARAELKNIQNQPGVVSVLDVPMPYKSKAGTLNVANAPYVIQTLDLAIELALANEICALVTGPIQKSVINESGLSFSGHTEYLRDKSNVDEVVMMLATEGLRVALATTHLPLKDVADEITQEKLNRIISILNTELIKHFGSAKPNILVCGLNPHAGEDGHLGREEIDTIIPALEFLRQQGINLQGPLPADTLFQPHYLDQADAVLAMYHDQGLPVLKYKGFGQAVNITLGLPFIRTSVDHGTALDLAGTGKANLGSLQVALNYAEQMAQHREQYYA